MHVRIFSSLQQIHVHIVFCLIQLTEHFGLHTNHLWKCSDGALKIERTSTIDTEDWNSIQKIHFFIWVSAAAIHVEWWKCVKVPLSMWIVRGSKCLMKRNGTKTYYEHCETWRMLSLKLIHQFHSFFLQAISVICSRSVYIKHALQYGGNYECAHKK